MSFKIIGSGSQLGGDVISHIALDTQLSLKPNTCHRRYGVESRCFAMPNQSALDLAKDALTLALTEADLTLQDIDALIYASGTHHQALPYDAAGLLHTMQAPHTITSFDINSTCLSFLSALDMAHCAMAANRFNRIAIVSSELPSRSTVKEHPHIATLFADGAAAFILEKEIGAQGLQAPHFETYASGYQHCQIRAGGTNLHPSETVPTTLIDASRFEMNGKALFKQATKLLPRFLDDGLKRGALASHQIDVVIPHQASHLALKRLPKLLGFKEEQVVNHFATLGNQVSASIPVVLDRYRHSLNVSQSRDIESSSNSEAANSHQVLLIGTAAGMSMGMGVITL